MNRGYEVATYSDGMLRALGGIQRDEWAGLGMMGM
jgi:hypothetical protein